MPWLDEYTGSTGLQLIFDMEHEEDHPDIHYYYTTVQNSKYWKRAIGVRVPLHPYVPKYLDSWPANKQHIIYSERMIKNNMKFIAHYKSWNISYDYIDHKYLQYGLDGCLWEEFPKGIPGILIDYTDPTLNHPGWVNVWVTPNFQQTPSGIQVPHKGILAWDT